MMNAAIFTILLLAMLIGFAAGYYYHSQRVAVVITWAQP
jgi:hypothetical protein